MRGADNLDEVVAHRLGERWLTSEAALRPYAQSEAHHGGHAPDRVARPVTAEEIQLVVHAAYEARVPLIAFGAGTSLEGNAEALSGGIILDLSLMNRVLDIRSEDLLAIVEPGVTREQLELDLRDTGLFFPIDPGANATLGGMIATRASGTNAVRYGTMRENTLALDVVLADGALIRTGTEARKSSAGYDLTHLFVGSEGTLGIIAKAALRLYGRPEAVIAASWPFASLEGAVATVIAVIQLGLPVARIELLDSAAIGACNRYSRLSLPEQPTLFIELHGSPAAVAEQLETIRMLGQAHGGGEIATASEAADRRQLWTARHAALPAARALVPGSVVWVTDVCVPISRLADAIAKAHSAIEAEGLTAPILGHVGDGNFHIFFVLERGDEAAFARASRVNEAVVAQALEAGGTCTGEHGIGLGKREALVAEHGADAVALMRRIKEVMDPSGILNPGKIFIPASVHL
jgi:D-lactate dehydrogenase (cytochrome)